MDLVAREVVGLWIVGADSVRIMNSLAWLSVGRLVLKEIFDIALSEFVLETKLHIFNFLRD